MEIEKLAGEKVIHKSFGEGMVIKAYDKYLEVDFPASGRQSRFSYPLCFDGYLRLEGKEKEEEIRKDLEQWKIESGALQREKIWEQYEKTQQAIRDRKATVEEKKRKERERTAEYRAGRNQTKTDDRQGETK